MARRKREKHKDVPVENQILVVTPTRNRVPQLERQLKQLKRYALQGPWFVEHLVINDGSHEYITEYRLLHKRFHEGHRYNMWYFKYRHAHGRDRYWCLWNDILTWIKARRFTYCIVLADDLELCSNFLNNAVRHLQYHREHSARYHCANLFARFPKNWGTIQYVDGAFICTRLFFEYLEWRIERIERDRFRHRPHLSSGVWQQVTHRLARGRVQIAPLLPVSLVKPMECDSIMFNPLDFRTRKKSRLWTSNFVDDLVQHGEHIPPHIWLQENGDEPH